MKNFKTKFFPFKPRLMVRHSKGRLDKFFAEDYFKSLYFYSNMSNNSGAKLRTKCLNEFNFDFNVVVFCFSLRVSDRVAYLSFPIIIPLIGFE